MPAFVDQLPERGAAITCMAQLPRHFEVDALVAAGYERNIASGGGFISYSSPCFPTPRPGAADRLRSSRPHVPTGTASSTGNRVRPNRGSALRPDRQVPDWP